MKNILGRNVRILGILILAFAVLASLLVGHAVTRSFPQTSGVVKVPGLRSAVQIIRDGNGIPHIYAGNAHDLFLAQGYVHAQDRFYQMDYWRHQTAGRLSELYGAGSLEFDKPLRTMGWARVAAQEYASADADTRAALEAYAEGVNAYLASRPAADLSLEYSILGLIGLSNYKPEPWTPVNSIAWGKAMAWNLSGNYRLEIQRALLLQSLGEAKANEISQLTYPADHPVIVPDPAFSAVRFEQLDQQARAIDRVLGGHFDGIGSNNWVIAGSRTTTGTPLLANDPHLGIQMPSIWYQIGLHCRALTADCPYDVVGYSLAGDSAVIIGHNHRIAWGVTNLGPDVQDLFLEKINPANSNQYDVNGQWVDMTIVQETLNIRGGASEPLTVRYTRNGPIISDIFESAQGLISDTVTINDVTLGPHYAVALRWTALEPGTLFEAVRKINRAQNWAEFREALRLWDVPAQNFVYADVDGNIGYQTPGNIPIRKSGDGTVPVPGWTDDYQWTGYIPFDELPSSFNPPQGYIATANNAVVGPEYQYLMSTDWDPGYRAARIVALIEAQPKISPEDIARIQGDNLHLGAREVLPYLLALNFDEDPKLKAAAEALRGWDLQMHMNSQPAAVYASFFKALLEEIFHDDLPEAFWPTGGPSSWLAVRGLLREPQNSWWDDGATPGVETRDDILRRAFAQGYAELETRFGSEPANWSWGQLHTATFANETLGSSASPGPIRALFNRGPFEASGGTSIVNATSYNLTRADPFAVTSVPSMRMIVDLGNFDNSRMIHTTGQSGHAFHRHYIDMADKWRLIDYNPMPYSPAAVQRAGVEVLTLEP